MATLGPEHGAARGFQAAPMPGWIANPCAGRVFAILVGQVTRQDEDLLSAATIRRWLARAGIEALDGHVFAVFSIGIQIQTGVSVNVASPPPGLRRIDDDAFAFGRRHLAQLYQDDAAGLRARRMLTARWIAHVGASRVVAVLVGKNSFEHEELFAERVDVRFENTCRRIAHERGRAG